MSRGKKQTSRKSTAIDAAFFWTLDLGNSKAIYYVHFTFPSKVWIRNFK